MAKLQYFSIWHIIKFIQFSVIWIYNINSDDWKLYFTFHRVSLGAFDQGVGV